MPKSTKTSSTGTATASKATGARSATRKAAASEVAASEVAVSKVAPSKAATSKAATSKAATSKAPAPKPGPAKAAKASKAAKAARTGGRPAEDPFLVSQRAALLAERGTYLSQAEELQAQADSLALEHEPGDVQFDEEGGEGGTSNVDRELDLLLSAQARGNIDEIDLALAKMDAGTYGRCEQCGQPIPEARLEALPHAALCVVCKAGGLSSRR